MRRLVALFAVQDHAEMLRAPFFGRHPGAAEKRRMVSHMLPVTAGQIGNPMAFFILVIADDGLVHVVACMLVPLMDSTKAGELSFLKRQFRTLRGRVIDPSTLVVLVETAHKHHIAIQMTKLRKCRATVARIDDAGVITVPRHRPCPWRPNRHYAVRHSLCRETTP